MLSVFAFFAYFMKKFYRQNMLIFLKIFNHRWRSLVCFHRFFWAQTHIFVKFIYKNPRNHLQNLWTSYHNFWHGRWTFRAICLLSICTRNNCPWRLYFSQFHSVLMGTINCEKGSLLKDNSFLSNSNLKFRMNPFFGHPLYNVKIIWLTSCCL